MSGGAFDYKEWYLGEWAQQIEQENPLLAEQLRDLHKLMGRYDYYLSGDIGKDGIQKAWEEYTAKWFHMDNEKVRQIMFEKCLGLCETVLKGYLDGKDEQW